MIYKSKLRKIRQFSEYQYSKKLKEGINIDVEYESDDDQQSKCLKPELDPETETKKVIEREYKIYTNQNQSKQNKFDIEKFSK